MLEQEAKNFNEYRQKLHASFPRRADALTNLIESLAGNDGARSAAEASLNPLFDRQYSSLHDAADNFFIEAEGNGAGGADTVGRDEQRQERIRAIADALPAPEKRPFQLFVLDTASVPRPFACTLSERSIVYSPNPAPGNKPIAAGHSYSVLAVLPEKEAGQSAPWAVPLSCVRVPPFEKSADIGAEQMEAVLNDNTLPFGGSLSVEVADSVYSAARHLYRMERCWNHAAVVRVRGNRTFYHMPPTLLLHEKRGAGHPRRHGSPFKLPDSDTWGSPDEEAVTAIITRKGRGLTVCLSGWHDILMSGKRGMPMHQCPFTLIRCVVTDNEGKSVFKRSLWIVVSGRRRRELSLIQAYEAYRQRYDIEHFFRFGKTRLLMDKYQTCVTEHEENWQELACLAYNELWLAAPLAEILPRPWERYSPSAKIPVFPGPGMVQRDFGRIIRQFGTPAASPEPRGNPPGRRKGDCPGRRPVLPIIFKGKKKQKNSLKETG